MTISMREKFKTIEKLFISMEEVFVESLSIEKKIEEMQFFAQMMVQVDKDFQTQQFKSKDEINESNK